MIMETGIKTNSVSHAITKNISSKTAQRIYSIDTFRVVSIFFIILHHIDAFNWSYIVYYPNPLFKFLYYFPKATRLLPFFFIAAGYFFHLGILRGESAGKRLWCYCKRLARLFFLWYFIYSFTHVPEWANMSGAYNPIEKFFLNAHLLISQPFLALIAGNITSLWFFPALIIGLITVTVFHKLNIDKYIIPFGFGLYLLTLLGKAYSVFLPGFEFNFEMRQGPLVSVLFVGIGWMLASKNDFHIKAAVVLIILGILMLFSEIIYFITVHNIKPDLEYLLSTIFINTGIFWFMLARPNIGKGTIFPNWGKLTLGVFCIHQLMMNIVGTWAQPYMSPIVFDIFRPTTIYFLCLVMTILLMRNKYTKLLVT